MIEVYAFTIGELATNCYLLKDTATGEMAVVDPATDEIIDIFNDIGCDFSKIKYIILTHGHFDHIYGTEPLKKLTKASVVISRAEAALLSDNNMNLSTFFVPMGIKEIVPDILVDEGTELKLGESAITFMLTPGHTSGSMCLVFEDNLVSGDTLFCESMGRTDLPTGDMGQILKSLAKLKALNGDYRVYPGHGRPSTLEHERKYNTYMN